MTNAFAFNRAVGLGLLLAMVGICHATESSKLFSVRDYGAAGDGITSDTKAIDQAIDTCSKAGGGQVLIPPGRYLTGTVQLRSHVTLFLDAGATLVGTTNLTEYSSPTLPAYMPESKWGKWLRGLIVGQGLEDVTICGQGTIDGHKVFDPTGEEHMRGPHTINFAECRRFTIRDISILDSANYAVFFQASDDVDVRNVKITGGWDGVHFRGAAERFCHNVNIINCQFYTGDDSIAGSFWDNVVISGCIVNSSCNGIRLIGPARHLIVDHCLFYGPGQQPHRSSARNNMLTGIILQPGAWGKTDGPLDDVLLSNNSMKEVASPVTIWSTSGTQAGRITISGLNATGVYRAAFSAESWGDAPITNVVLRNAYIEYNGGGTADQAKNAVEHPHVDCRSLPSWGLYARNVGRFTVEDVRLSLSKDDFRPAVMTNSVTEFKVDGFQYCR